MPSVEAINVYRQDVKRAQTEWIAAITANDNIKFMQKVDFDSKYKKPLAPSTKADVLFKQTLNCRSDGVLLAFTNYGNAIKLELEQFDDVEFRASGIKLKSFYDAALNGERVVKLFDISDGLPEGDVLFFTKQGMAKRSEWAEYGLLKAVYPAIKLKTGDEIVNVETFVGDEYTTM